MRRYTLTVVTFFFVPSLIVVVRVRRPLVNGVCRSTYIYVVYTVHIQSLRFV